LKSKKFNWRCGAIDLSDGSIRFFDLRYKYNVGNGFGMKTHIADRPGRTGERNQRVRPVLRPAFRLVTILACFLTAQSYSQTNRPPTEAGQSLAFDEDGGFDATWAAEKKLIALFKAEGYLMIGQPFTNHIENALFRAGQRITNGTAVLWEPTEKATVRYAYVPAMYPQPAIYRLSATRGSPGCAVLMSVAGKISSDRLSALREALQEFESTKTPVVKVKGDFTKRGDFRVKVNQDTVELENRWKSKGL
jgi:hypothetical protein